MLTEGIYTPDQPQYFNYDPFEKVKRFKTKFNEARKEYDETFARKDFYWLLCRDLKE
jgi:CRISPR/Cas system Type II protein with McrA/HNH and RuvC-like nuclease domain